MYNEQLAKMLAEYLKKDLVSVRISGTNKHLKIMNVEDSCDVGMLDIVVEPFTDETNYYSETHDYANIIEKSEKDENRMA